MAPDIIPTKTLKPAMNCRYAALHSPRIFFLCVKYFDLNAAPLPLPIYLFPSPPLTKAPILRPLFCVEDEEIAGSPKQQQQQEANSNRNTDKDENRVEKDWRNFNYQNIRRPQIRLEIFYPTNSTFA